MMLYFVSKPLNGPYRKADRPEAEPSSLSLAQHVFSPISRLAHTTTVPDVRCTQPRMSPQGWRKASLRLAFSRTWWVDKSMGGRTATMRCNWVGPSEDALVLQRVRFQP
jgi:hypothetical protein